MEQLPTSDFFPALNASINFCSFVFLLLGFWCVRNGRVEWHKKWMTLATLSSIFFLSSYVYYHYNFRSQPFKGEGFIKYLYFSILISHVILAALIIPFIVRLLGFAFRKDWQRHKNLGRKLWPFWIYVSATGVLIYFFLYQW